MQGDGLESNAWLISFVAHVADRNKNSAGGTQECIEVAMN
jgi:hypothetical protein